VNELPTPLLTGTFGELLVQIRLLQHSVQAVAPHKDTGNDLLAVRGEVFRAIQVKTTSERFPVTFDCNITLERKFHVLAIVVLHDVQFKNLDDFEVPLDECQVFLLEREQVTKGYFTLEELAPYAVSKDRVNEIFNK
jgi:hypothetical protein